ncbi:MAG: thiol reductant ABC exporter subunit CydC [Verrucomicrobia bacterium 61-8]|nr:thiol reductant ABC exporter subunit CydC [Verrucomicrobiota bacterium]OJV14002.1 MAG: thiol reductant ABC exporter subunit CydC [Verrucomicrobia bacterium 61-8]
MTHRQTIIRLWQVLRPLRGTLGLSVAMRIVNQFLAVVLIVLAVWGVTAIARGGSSQMLWTVAFALAGLGMVKGIFRYLEQFSGHYVAFRLLADLRRQLFASLEAMAPAGLGRERSGDLVSRAIADVERVEVFYAHTIAPFVVAVVVPLAVVGVLAWISPMIALGLLPFLVLTGVGIPFAAHRIGTGAAGRVRDRLGEISARFTDVVQGIRETLVFGYGSRSEAILDHEGDLLASAQKTLSGCHVFQSTATEIGIGSALLVVVFLGAGEVLSGEMPAYDFPVVLALTLSAFVPLLGVTNLIPDFEQAISSARRLFDIIDRPCHESPCLAAVGGEPRSVGVVFDKVGFAYDDGSPRVLDRVSFAVEPGAVTAIVGASGAGKSTLVNLLLRYWREDAGEILLGDVPIRNMAARRVRELIAVVPQRVHIFNTTLRENIGMARPDAAMDDIIEAARLACIHEFIMDQPEGYDTMAHEGGARLSGGQRQRIAIARAFLSNAPILVMDEATAHLDERTESRIMESVRVWQSRDERRAVLVIAHRLACVRDASRIMVLEHGRVAGIGCHEALLDSCEVYSDLFAAQSGAAQS